MCKCGEFVDTLGKEYVVCGKCGDINFNFSEKEKKQLEEVLYNITGICPTLNCNKFITFTLVDNNFFNKIHIKDQKLYECPFCSKFYFGKIIREYSQLYAKGI